MTPRRSLAPPFLSLSTRPRDLELAPNQKYIEAGRARASDGGGGGVHSPTEVRLERAAYLILRTEAGSGGEGPFIVIVVVVIIIVLVFIPSPPTEIKIGQK